MRSRSHFANKSGEFPDLLDVSAVLPRVPCIDGMTDDGSIVYFTTRDPLHHGRPGHRHERRHLQGRRQRLRRDSHPGLDRLRRVGNSDSCDPVGEHRQRALERGRRDRRPTAARWRSAAAAASRPTRGRSTSSAPSCSTAPATGRADAPNLYIAEPGLRAAFRRHAGVEPDRPASAGRIPPPTPQLRRPPRTLSSSRSTPPGGPPTVTSTSPTTAPRWSASTTRRAT